MIFLGKFQIIFFLNKKKFRKWVLSQLMIFRSPHNQPPPLPPSKVTRSAFRSKKMCNVLKPMENNFPIFIFWEIVDFLLKLLENSDRFLPTWNRNANQCYPVTGWLWGFNPKAPRGWWRSTRWGVWEAKPSTNRGFLELFFLNFFFAPKFDELFLAIFFPFS